MYSCIIFYVALEELWKITELRFSTGSVRHKEWTWTLKTPYTQLMNPPSDLTVVSVPHVSDMSFHPTHVWIAVCGTYVWINNTSSACSITNALILSQVLLTSSSQHASGSIITYCIWLSNVVCKRFHVCINRIFYVSTQCDIKRVCVCFPVFTLWSM